MALNRYVDVLINNKDCKATLKEPLVVFEKDKNAHIYFRLVDYRYQYKLTTATEDDWNIVYNLKGADAWITIVKPDGTEVEQGKEGNNVNNVILKDAYVRFILSPELTDEITEMGTYLLQIHITDKEGGEVTIPSFSFEVKERLKGTSPAATVLLLTEEGNNLTTEQGTPMVASGNGVTISSLPARNTYTGNEYMAVAFGGATYKMPTSLLKGADGITPTLKIGTVNTLPAGANATVTATTSNNIVTLDFGIPRGADGSGGSGSGDGHTHANKTELDKFVSGDKAKLDTASTHAGTAHAPSNAEQNVQSDWNITDTSSDAYIKNKPAIPAVTQVVDNLTSTDTNKALSANQGKVLDEKVATNASSIAQITQQQATDLSLSGAILKLKKSDGTAIGTGVILPSNENEHTHDNKLVLDGVTNVKVDNWDNAYNHSQSSHLSIGTTSATAYRGDYGDIAYTHSQSVHAPSTAQKNSDITKTEIEAKLIGDISTHTHSGYASSSHSHTKSQITDFPTIPTKTSQLTNDNGFLTSIPKDILVTTNIVGSTLTLTTDKYQKTNMVNGTTIALPAVSSFTEIHLFFSTTADLTLILPNAKWQITPAIKANKNYELIFTYTDKWLGGVVQYG